MKTYTTGDVWTAMFVAGMVGVALTVAATTPADRDVINAFHVLYHNKRWDTVKDNTRWLGAPAMKNPLDMWVFQEIVHETKPDVLVETGTNRGGAAYYFAGLFDLIGNGRVLTMDIADLPKPKHPRIHFRLDSSTSDNTLKWLTSNIRPGERVMVTLDSNHDKEHVLRELDLYAPLVSPGCYLVVEDTHLNGHPIRVRFSPSPGHAGPWEALDEWLPRHAEFERDRSREKFGMTFNPGGWLRRVR